MRAKRFIPKGEFVAEYVGEKVTQRTSQIRADVYAYTSVAMYFFELDFGYQPEELKSQNKAGMYEYDSVFFC